VSCRGLFEFSLFFKNVFVLNTVFLSVCLIDELEFFGFLVKEEG